MKKNRFKKHEYSKKKKKENTRKTQCINNNHIRATSANRSPNIIIRADHHVFYKIRRNYS